MKTLFQHTGALIGNKFSRHRRKSYQPLRQMSTYSSFIPVADLAESSPPLPPQQQSNDSNQGEQSTSSPPPPISTTTNNRSSYSSPMLQVTEPTPVSPPSLQYPWNDNYVGNNDRRLQRSHTSSTLHAKTPLRSHPTSPNMAPVSEQHQASTSGGGGLRSRATSLVRGITRSNSTENEYQQLQVGGNTNNTHVGNNNSLSVSTSPESPLHKLRRLTSRKASSSGDATSAGVDSKENVKAKRQRIIDAEQNYDEDDSDSEEEDWPNLKSPSSSDEDDDDEREGSMQHSEGGKNKSKGFFKRLL